jgi:Domain of unknown function (DUF4333)
MRLALALSASALLLAACAGVSTSSNQPPSVSGGGITTLPATVQTSSPSPSEVSPSASTAPGQINAASLISTIEQQYNQNYGTTITVTCPRSGTFASTPGDSFQCNFTDAGGHTGTMTVSITSSQGDFNWTIP